MNEPFYFSIKVIEASPFITTFNNTNIKNDIVFDNNFNYDYSKPFIIYPPTTNNNCMMFNNTLNMKQQEKLPIIIINNPDELINSKQIEICQNKVLRKCGTNLIEFFRNYENHKSEMMKSSNHNKLLKNRTKSIINGDGDDHRDHDHYHCDKIWEARTKFSCCIKEMFYYCMKKNGTIHFNVEQHGHKSIQQINHQIINIIYQTRPCLFMLP